MVDALHASSQGQRTKHCRVHNGHLWRIAAKFTFPTLCVCVWNSVVKHQSWNRSETTRRGVNVFVGHERPQWHFVSGPTQSSRHRWTTGTSELSALAPVASCGHGACSWPSLDGIHGEPLLQGPLAKTLDMRDFVDSFDITGRLEVWGTDSPVLFSQTYLYAYNRTVGSLVEKFFLTRHSLEWNFSATGKIARSISRQRSHTSDRSIHYVWCGSWFCLRLL